MFGLGLQTKIIIVLAGLVLLSGGFGWLYFKYTEYELKLFKQQRDIAMQGQQAYENSYNTLLSDQQKLAARLQTLQEQTAQIRADAAKQKAIINALDIEKSGSVDPAAMQQKINDTLARLNLDLRQITQVK